MAFAENNSNICPDESKTEQSRTEQNRTEKKGGNRNIWILYGICIAFLCSVLYTSCYGFFLKEAKTYQGNPVEAESNIRWLFQSSYLLYRDLYNKENQTDLSYRELYFPLQEGYEWLEDERIAEANWEEEGPGIPENMDEDAVYRIRNALLQLNGCFETYEEDFSALNSFYDYLIRDLVTGEFITNTSQTEMLCQDYFFYLSFQFDEYGNVTIPGEINGVDETAIRKSANDVIRNNTVSDYLRMWLEDSAYAQYFQASMPRNCVVTYGITQEVWDQIQNHYYTGTVYQSGNSYKLVYNMSMEDAFYQSWSGDVLLLLLCAVFLAAMFLGGAGKGEPWNSIKVCRMPFEVLFFLGCIWLALISPILAMAFQTGSGILSSDIISQTEMIEEGAVALSYGINIFILILYFFGAWYAGICFRAVREMGIKEYIKKKCIVYRIFPYVKAKIAAVYDAVSHFDVTRNAHKLILKIVLVNALILFVIGSFWFGGFGIAVVYSIFLYLILRKYISDLQKKYGILLGAINEIAEGNLNVTITEDLGVFEPFKPQLIRIQNGFRNAVDAEVKSQRMKAELITNVSHDLKTPLTAIITYVNLLKEENITEQQRREYLDTLERKSLRLKVLIEDLFEVSKANSQNITLNIMDVDIMNLLRQVVFEMSDKLAASELDVRMSLPEEKVILPLDSQKTYRIYENLFGNIAKYALHGTRVYVNAIRRGDELEIALKNITAEEISVNAEELTERFVRGDSSRNTEGSGLGLAIAKSFTELQNGSLEISVDGDLFKVTTRWKLPKES